MRLTCQNIALGLILLLINCTSVTQTPGSKEMSVCTPPNWGTMEPLLNSCWTFKGYYEPNFNGVVNPAHKKRRICFLPDGKMEGHGGINFLKGTYTYTHVNPSTSFDHRDGIRITITQRTEMAGDDLAGEERFIAALGKVNEFAILSPNIAPNGSTTLGIIDANEPRLSDTAIDMFFHLECGTKK